MARARALRPSRLRGSPYFKSADSSIPLRAGPGSQVGGAAPSCAPPGLARVPNPPGSTAAVETRVPCAAMPERFARRKLDDVEIWLDFEGGRFYGLNESAATIFDAWQRGVRDPGAIADLLVERFEVTREVALEAVDTVLRETKARGLRGD